MKVYTRYTDIAAEYRNASVAIGNFDGVHKGHQAVLDLARAHTRDGALPFGVVTFEPHPREVFQPDAPPFRLMTPPARLHRLEKLGVDVLFELPFTSELRSLSAAQFVEDVLASGLGVSHVVTGADFRFGRGREGGADMLANLCGARGIETTAADLVAGADGEYSSSAIRAALSAGQPEIATQMLGHFHRIEGVVIHGEKRGRELGFPTINIALDNLHRPKFGVYAVLVDVLTGSHRGSYEGCASIGERPTFGINAPNLEVYLLDFEGDLYGETVSVALAAYQRGELKFDSAQALIAQMQQDVAQTRAYFDARGPT